MVTRRAFVGSLGVGIAAASVPIPSCANGIGRFKLHIVNVKKVQGGNLYLKKYLEDIKADGPFFLMATYVGDHATVVHDIEYEIGSSVEIGISAFSFQSLNRNYMDQWKEIFWNKFEGCFSDLTLVRCDDKPSYCKITSPTGREQAYSA